MGTFRSGNVWGFAGLLLVFSVASGVVGAEETPELRPVKNVILFIGDGVSIPQLMMTEEFLRKTENRGLLVTQLPYQALTFTRAANAFITDSAAAGTAIACGEKTNNGRIGMDASGTRRLESVAEVARDAGRKVGIVTSVTLNHATPAAFYAHNQSRGSAYAIGLDLVASNFDYFGGGGLERHNHKEDPDYKGDIYELAREAGYAVGRDRKDFEALTPGVKAISLGAGGALPYAIDMKPDTLRLADFTRQALEFLDNPNGFFLMVEGGKIDWMCHANDAATTLREVIDFDDALLVAYEFARQHPDDTLLVITGDHETGGLTLGFAGTGYSSYIELLAHQKSSGDEMRRAFRKWGEKREDPAFEDIKPLVTEQTGLIFGEGSAKHGTLQLSPAEEAELENAFQRQVKDGKYTGGDLLAQAAIRMLNNKAAVAWTSGAHTALPVQTTAFGPEGHHFANAYENTEIARRLKQAVR